MPFDATDPTDSEKIRRLGTVIRPNWKAIEEGSNDDANPNKLKYWAINYFSRDDIPAAPGNDAPAVTDGITLYAKTDSDSGQPELFTVHEDATVTQMTKGPATIGPIGNTSNGETSLYGGLLFKYGTTAVLAANATTTITFTSEGLTAFPNNIFNVIVNPIASDATFNVKSLTTTSFGIENSAGTRAYNWIAIGN